MLPAAQMNMLPLAQLLLLKEAVDAASEQWEREQAERRRREAEERAREEAIEAEKSRQAKPRPAKNPPPVFPFFWWELASGTSVHMNGRIYDPLLGRMLSADPNIQSPAELQNYNRYSYVTNNPLSMTDPSGFFFKKLFKKIGKFFKKFWETIVTIALAAINPLLAAAFVVAMGAINGGFRGALIAIASIAIFGMPGNGGTFSTDLLKEPFIAMANATVQGIAHGGFAELAGSDFQSGFLGGFSGSLVGSALANSDINGTLQKVGFAESAGTMADVQEIVSAAVVGGTIAEIGGGKFANGAVSAAFGASLRVIRNNLKMGPPEMEVIEVVENDSWNGKFISSRGKYIPEPEPPIPYIEGTGAIRLNFTILAVDYSISIVGDTYNNVAIHYADGFALSPTASGTVGFTVTDASSIDALEGVSNTWGVTAEANFVTIEANHVYGEGYDGADFGIGIGKGAFSIQATTTETKPLWKND